MNEKMKNFEEDDFCDLDPEKICDSCEKCLGLTNSDYRIVRVDGLMENENYVDIDEYLSEDEIHDLDSEYDEAENDAFDVDYIEDIPELKEEYEKKINKILGRE